jgi:hypothetical protein
MEKSTIASWRDGGFDQRNAAAWIRVAPGRFTPFTARQWAAEGFEANDAGFWSEVYADPCTARKRRAAGYADPFDAMLADRQDDEPAQLAFLHRRAVGLPINGWRRIVAACVAVVAALWWSADFIGRLRIVSEAVEATRGPNREARFVDWITATPVWIPGSVLLVALVLVVLPASVWQYVRKRAPGAERAATSYEHVS